MSRFRMPRLRFGMRALLIFCVLPIPFLTWLANAKFRAVRQAEAIAYFQSRGCDIGLDEDAHSTPGVIKKFCDLIDPNIVLRSSYLSSTKPIQPEDVEQLERLQGLQNLHFDRQAGQPKAGDYTLSDRDARRLVSIKSLAAITLDAHIEPDSIRGLAQLPELDSVMLPNVKFDSRLLEALSAKPKIAALEFNGSGLDRGAYSTLAKLPLFQTLVIHDPAPNTLQSLSECRALTGLGLFDCKLSVSDAHAIKSLRIRTLDLVNPTIEEGFFRILERHPSIVRVSIQNGTEFFSTSAPADEGNPVRLAEWSYCENHFTTVGVIPKPSSMSAAP